MGANGGSYVAAAPTGSFGSGTTETTVTDLSASTGYVFRVRAERDGLYSTWSEGESVTTDDPAPVAPAAPSVFVDSVGITEVELSWGIGESVDGFEVQVKANGGSYVA